jgi:hypothetical protein
VVGDSESPHAGAAKFAGKPRVNDEFPANTITCRSQDPGGYQGFLNSSQATNLTVSFSYSLTACDVGASSTDTWAAS